MISNHARNRQETDLAKHFAAGLFGSNVHDRMLATVLPALHPAPGDITTKTRGSGVDRGWT
jgi:hypothetical protein